MFNDRFSFLNVDDLLFIEMINLSLTNVRRSRIIPKASGKLFIAKTINNVKKTPTTRLACSIGQ